MRSVFESVLRVSDFDTFLTESKTQQCRRSRTTYYPDQREIALGNTQIVDPHAQYFLYNKYHPQLLGMILERTTGMWVTEYTQTRLWNPLGMEFSGAWALDSEASGFEKMEARLNA